MWRILFIYLFIWNNTYVNLKNKILSLFGLPVDNGEKTLTDKKLQKWECYLSSFVSGCTIAEAELQ